MVVWWYLSCFNVLFRVFFNISLSVYWQQQSGYWNLNSGRGCQVCGCDSTGALNGTCNPTTGACYCLPGIGGQACDRCLPGYFGFSASGCRGKINSISWFRYCSIIYLNIRLECEPCNKPGHVCDPDTGRCVCPTGTEGPQCQTCTTGTWNYNPLKGCKVLFFLKNVNDQPLPIKNCSIVPGMQLSYSRIAFQSMWPIHRCLSL